ITPADVKNLLVFYELIGAFNVGVEKYNDEVLLLLRVAERPISYDPNVIKATVFDPRTQTMELLTFHRDDPD
ncbi:glycosidase, partial [Enterococcus gallinarum]